MIKAQNKTAMKMAGILSGKGTMDKPTPLQQAIQGLPSITQVDEAKPASHTPVLSPGNTFTISLHLVDDSPYQPRLEIDPEKLDELAESMKALGHVDQPIRVRQLGDRYQLIAGHRRILAAKNLGWEVIHAEIVSMTDHEAELSTLINNLGNEDLSDFEKALLYQRALKNGHANTQKDLASLFATSQASVSGSLSMLTLPEEVLTIFHRHPRAISRSTSKEIATLLESHPACIELILSALKRITIDKAPQSSLKSWVEQRIASANRQRGQNSNTRLIALDGKELYKLKQDKKTGTIEVRISPGVASDDLLNYLTQVLNERAIKERQK